MLNLNVTLRVCLIENKGKPKFKTNYFSIQVQFKYHCSSKGVLVIFDYTQGFCCMLLYFNFKTYLFELVEKPNLFSVVWFMYSFCI